LYALQERLLQKPTSTGVCNDNHFAGHEGKRSNSDTFMRRVVIADDTFHLRSMRAELWRLSRDAGAAFVLVHVHCSIEDALQHNASRANTGGKVPEAVLHRTAARFEHPMSTNGAPWDRNVLVFSANDSIDRANPKGNQDEDALRTTSCHEQRRNCRLVDELWHRVWAAWGVAPHPVTIDARQRALQVSAAREATTRDIAHQVDVKTRHAVTETMEKLKHLPGDAKNVVARALNAERRRRMLSFSHGLSVGHEDVAVGVGVGAGSDAAGGCKAKEAEDLIAEFRRYCESQMASMWEEGHLLNESQSNKRNK
jgi:tRNA uridine 5-carbamoylmethylation protein Kti12